MDTSYYKKYEPFFSSWYIRKQIGEGSFGKVYEIEREDFGRTYKAALKIITIPQTSSEVKSAMAEGMDEHSTRSYFRGLVEELVDEFDIMSKVKGNTNIVSYEDHAVFEHTDDIGWDIVIRMELLTPLLDYVKEHPFTENDVIKMGCDICSALEVCRKHNIVHRDIKPENIFVSSDGNFKLGDFGISRTVEKTTSGLSKKGTYTYMAPEVYKGQPYSASVDIYSLGIVLYRFLNQNRTPFMPDYPAPITYTDRESALEKRIKGEPIPAIKNIAPELSNAILKACSHNPVNRYATPAEFKQALSDASGTNAKSQGNPVDVSPESTEAFFAEADAGTKKLFVDTVPASEKTEAFNEKTGSFIEESEATQSIFNDTSTDFDWTVGTDNVATPAPESVGYSSAPAPKKKGNGVFIAGIAAGIAAIIIVMAVVIFNVAKGPEMKWTESQMAGTDAQTEFHVTSEIPYIITMGTYEQDNNTSNGADPIEWYVVDEQDDKLLLVSKYAIDAMVYSAPGEEARWETCMLRKYLNEVFISAFTEEEAECIVETSLETVHKSPSDGTERTDITSDKIFLLTYDEYDKYAERNDLPLCIYQTPVAKRLKNHPSSKQVMALTGMGGIVCETTDYGTHARDSHFDNIRMSYTNGVLSTSGRLRYIYPAMWISVDNDYFRNVLEPGAKQAKRDEDKAITIVDAEIAESYNYDGDEPFGKNADGELVYWKMFIIVESTDALDFNQTGYVSCSWDDDIVDASYEDFSLIKADSDCIPIGIRWNEAKMGETQYRIKSRTVEILLPDNPAIEGSQYVTIADATIYFDLESLGDYSTGTGWKMNNIRIG